MLVPEGLIAYSATKAAILSISRSLAQTTKGTRVTVNAVVPGSTLTEGAKNFLQEQAKKDKLTEQEVADNFFKNVRTTSILVRFISHFIFPSEKLTIKAPNSSLIPFVSVGINCFESIS